MERFVTREHIKRYRKRALPKAVHGDQDTPIPKAALLLPRSSSFEQKPSAPLGLVDPNFQETCCRDIAMLLAKVMRLAHVSNQLLVVVA